MHKLLTAAAVGVALGSAVMASAASRDDNMPEARAYLNFNFGGAASLPKNFHYGMRLDYDHRFVSHPMPAMLQMDFSESGFSDARFNGLPFVRRYALNQAEGAAAGAAGGVNVVDWTLLVVGAAGLGVAGYEVSNNSKSDTAPATTGSSTGGGGGTTGGSTTGSTGGSTTGSTTGGSTTGGSTTGGSTTGGSTTGGATTGGLLGYAEFAQPVEATRHSREYQQWLDGGTGQMGDLAPAK